MLYPVYVWPGDDAHAHGAQVHDFPGCFSAADSWEELPAMVQEAVECWCTGEEITLPTPTPLGELLNSPDYKGGSWLLLDLDVTRLDTKPVRLNISLPSGLVKMIDRYAAEHHLTRSGFLASASREAMQK
jgi:predicted RNase H-like HicB family nuclease